ncbi:MAG: FlaA1/EpsC-like NDP-sugar epimerase [Polaribacter sp.]|jgi:FlaA1/EpsC-like NDP-sugar epimerase
MKEYLKKRLIKSNTPRWLVLLIDSYIILNTLVLSYIIRFNFTFNFDYSQLPYQLPFVLIIFLFSFYITGSFKGIIRHTGIRDALNVIIASFIAFLVLAILVLINRYFNILEYLTIPISILTIHFLINVIVLITSRFLFKAFYYLLVSDIKDVRRILIYGAGEAGLRTYSLLSDDKVKKVYVAGFIDDNLKKVGRQLHGLSVFNAKKITEEFIEIKRIDEIIIAIREIKPLRLLEIVDKLSKLPVKVSIVPPLNSWYEGNLNLKQIKKVKIEDLLGRESIKVDNPILKKEFNSKVALITGAAGSIGAEISKQLSNYKYDHLVLIDQAESDLYNLQQFFVNKGVKNITAIVADVRDNNRMNTILQQFQPNIIFHAAAYKHVPFMEENPYEAINVNIEGTKRIANLAVKHQVEKFVLISTDKAVNPTNIMGASKRIAEMYINCLNRESNTKFITTRFGNVLGSNGSVIPLFKNQIENGGPLTLTHKDITRFFMTIPEACQLVLEAGAMGNGGEIFVFDMGESIKIFDLAKNMIHLSGLKYPDDIDIKIIGLRPGEKIYEELLADGENTKVTYHEKIMIANSQKLNLESVKTNINKLCEVNKELDFHTAVLLMKKIVPEFVSNNSEFAVLDSLYETEISR